MCSFSELMRIVLLRTYLLVERGVFLERGFPPPIEYTRKLNWIDLGSNKILIDQAWSQLQSLGLDSCIHWRTSPHIDWQVVALVRTQCQL
jgi:hypothetical protein